MGRTYRTWSLLLPGLLLAASCGPSFKEVAKGLEMKVLREGDGKAASGENDYYYMRVHVKDKNDKTLACDNIEPDFFYLAQNGQAAYSYDFTHALHLLKVRDSVVFRCAADSFLLNYYGIERPKCVTPELNLHVSIQNIMTPEEYQAKIQASREESKVKAMTEFSTYLNERKIEEPPTGFGIVKVTESTGKGRQAQWGDEVLIHMIQRTLDGRELQNSYTIDEPMLYIIGGDGGLAAMDQGLKDMREGEKVRVYAPYFLAFGEAGLPPQVPPFTNMIFEMELLEVHKK